MTTSTSYAQIWQINPAVTASSAYSAGNSVGALQTINTGFPNAVYTISDVFIATKSTQTGEFDVVVFGANPGSTTIADKTAFSLNVADVNKVQACFVVTSNKALGTPSGYTLTGLTTRVQSDAGGFLYVAVVTQGTPTFTATSDVFVNIKAAQ